MPHPASPRQPPIGEVIAIGDELTTGQRLDTNTQWLAERLSERGVAVRYHTTVADDLAANVAVFRAAAARADVVVATGGLGPTADDLTRDAMAAAAGVELIEDPALVAHVEGLFASRGRAMPPQNRRQAQLPAGSLPIPNPAGTAPGVDQTVGRCRLFALPGVPAEMRAMWDASVAPALDAIPGERRVTRHWLVRCFGAGESQIESMVPGLIERGREPLVGITASHATITLRVTASGPDGAACLAAMEPTLAEIRRALGPLVFAEQPAGEEEIDLAAAVVRLLGERGLRVNVLEHATAGLLTHSLCRADRGRVAVGRCEVAPVAPAIDAAGDLLRRIAGDAPCAIAVGSREGDTVRVAAQSPAGTTCRDVTLFGPPSIHDALAAKHALNLLRLGLLSGAG